MIAPTATLAQRISDAAELLTAVTETPRLDAELLMAHALGIRRAQLLARLQDTTDPPRFEALLARRLAYEPIGYIMGTWEFFSMELAMRAPVLVPRPETEHLVEVILEFLADRPGAADILELGVGSGAVALAVARNHLGAKVIATDIAPAAIVLAKENAKRHHLDERVSFRQGDLFAALGAGDGPFDVVCSNPPYVESGAWPSLSPVITRYEDPGAVVSGADGLDMIRRLIAEASGHLRPGGLLAFEMGMEQHISVRALLESEGYEAVAIRRDLAGLPRIAFAKKPSR